MHSPAKVLTSDEDLACRAQQGCVESFEELLRRFQAPLLQFLRQRGFHADAEDLAQEAFLRAYQNLHRYDRQWTFSTWLFTIANRIGINHRRRTRPVADAAAMKTATAVGPGPLDAMTLAEDRRRLWDLAANVLSEEQMTAIWLYYVEDMSLKEIAHVQGRSRASIKIMLFRARRRLLPLLGEFDDEDPLRSRIVAGEASHV
jgi:RNA polymerase sigma-70 factor (ECF subfamily)